MKLSVLLLTYNHASFVAKALSSVLAQQTDFSFEIVVGEDCSTDDTLAIVSRFEDSHPEKVRVLRRGRNLGMQANFIDTYRQCRGDYVAFLDGDDYWTDSAKLQKQADYLDQHHDFSFCFHNSLILDEGNSEGREGGAIDERYAHRSTFLLEDLIEANFVPSCSIVARNRLIKEFPDWVLGIHGIDWTFSLLNARYGPFGKLDGRMAVYRRHSGGAWSSMPTAGQTKIVLEIYRRIKDEMPPSTWPLIDAKLCIFDLDAGLKWQSGAIAGLQTSLLWHQATIKELQEGLLWHQGTVKELQEGLLWHQEKVKELSTGLSWHQGKIQEFLLAEQSWARDYAAMNQRLRDLEQRERMLEEERANLAEQLHRHERSRGGRLLSRLRGWKSWAARRLSA